MELANLSITIKPYLKGEAVGTALDCNCKARASVEYPTLDVRYVPALRGDRYQYRLHWQSAIMSRERAAPAKTLTCCLMLTTSSKSAFSAFILTSHPPHHQSNVDKKTENPGIRRRTQLPRYVALFVRS